jgi:hypothetical protein
LEEYALQSSLRSGRIDRLTLANGNIRTLKIAHSSTHKLRAIRKLWRSFNPACSISGGRITSRSLSFESVRILGAGVAASWLVTASKVDEERCSLQVRMGLYDERVNALRSTALGLDSSNDFDTPTTFSLTDRQPDFLDFDVLTVSSMMDGQDRRDSPLKVDQFAHVVADYSRRIDRIWNFVGEPSVKSLERLAIWVLRNSDVGSIWHTLLGGICGAFTYGEKELAHELIAQLMSEWEEFRRVPSDRVSDVYDHVCRQVSRLQEAVRKPN